MLQFDLKATFFQHLTKRKFSERQMVVKKIPIGAGNVLDVRSHRNEPPIWLQCSKGLLQSPLQRGFRRQMFQEIAREYNVQAGVLHGPLIRTVLLQNNYVGICMPLRIRIQVHSKLSPARRRIDEFAPAATQVKHHGSRRNPTREEMRQNRPDFLSIRSSFREACSI